MRCSRAEALYEVEVGFRKWAGPQGPFYDEGIHADALAALETDRGMMTV